MFSGKAVAVTGARGGIGRAVAERFAALGARVSVSDLAPPEPVGDGPALACDVASESAIRDFIAQTEAALGPIDVFVANAGVGYGDLSHAASATDERWEASWHINVMQSVWAARALLPGWIARGEGRMVVVASAAGLLNQIGSASYSATKAAAVAFAENLAITHARDGIKVNCVCPQFVRTDMTAHMKLDPNGPLALKEPEDVADALIDAIQADRFLVLPHPVVAKYARNKGQDRDRWLAGMVDIQDAMGEQFGLKAFKES